MNHRGRATSSPCLCGDTRSAFFIAAYAALSIPAVIAGFAVNPLGLAPTFEILGAVVAVLALVVAVQAWRTRPRLDVLPQPGGKLVLP